MSDDLLFLASELAALREQVRELQGREVPGSVTPAGALLVAAPNGTVAAAAGLTYTFPLLAGTFDAFQFGRNFGNGDAYIRTNANSGNTFLALTGGSYQSIFSTNAIDSGAQIVLHGNASIFGYGILELQAGQSGTIGEIRFVTNGTLRGRITKSGRWGINVDPSSLNHMLTVQSADNSSGSYAFVVRRGDGQNLLFNRSDGGYNFINTAWVVGSSETNKKYIADVQPRAARTILARQQPKRYKRRAAAPGDSNRWEYGLIAEQVAATDPDLAHFDPDTGDGGVLYNDYIPLLIADTNAQAQRVAALEAQVAAQDTTIADLTRRLAALERQ